MKDIDVAGMGGFRGELTAEALAQVSQSLEQAGGSKIPHNFERTAPVHNPHQQRGKMPQTVHRNPQTLALLKLLDLPYNLEPQAQNGAGEGQVLSIDGSIHSSLFNLHEEDTKLGFKSAL